MACFAAHAQSDNDRFDVRIEGGELGFVMENFHEQTGALLLFSNDLVKIDGINPVEGRYSMQEALDIMLQGTGLSGGLTEHGMIFITRNNEANALIGENAEMNTNLKKSLLAGATFAMVTMGQQSVAQEVEEATTVAQDKDLVQDTIVVTGIRQSLEQAVSVKRNSSVIADVISSTGLGRFPDENVAESLQRVTGVQIQRLRGEGSQVSIRGLPPAFTATTLNGSNMASAFALTFGSPPSRNFEFSVLPSEFVSTLEVHKTSSAALNEGGLAGTVIVRTPRALDIGKRSIALSAQGAYESNSGDTKPRVAGLYTDVFADGKLGVTLGGAFSQRKSESHSHIARGFRARNDFVNNIVILERFQDERERTSFIAGLDWQPTENLRLYTDFFRTELDNHGVRSNQELQFGNTYRDAAPGDIVDQTRQDINGDLITTQLTLNNVLVFNGGRYQPRAGNTTSLNIGGEYETGPWTFSGEVSSSKSEQSGDDLRLFTRGVVSQLGYDVTGDNEVTNLNFADGVEQYILDPNNFVLHGLFGNIGSEVEDKIFSTKFDAARETDWGIPITFKFGASYSEQEQFGSSNRYGIESAVFADLVGLSPVVGEDNTFAAAPVIQVVEAGGGDFLDAYDGPSYFPSTFLASNSREVIESLSREDLETLGEVSPNLPGITDIEEKILALYGQMDFASSDDRISGNIGVRVVSTDQVTRGFSADLDAITFNADEGVFFTIPADTPISVDRSYTEILPSFNLRLGLTDDILMRFAASRTMARPSLAEISPSTTASATPPTINTNNPHLDPFISNNFDASLEWYFDDASILSATFFYKDIVSLIENVTTEQAIDILQIFADDSTQTTSQIFDLKSKVNGEGASLQGAEFTFQHSFTNLPGLLSNTGALVNYTYIDNSAPERIVGSSTHNFNLSGYYETDKLGMRLSYTWRDKHLVSRARQENFGLFVEAGGILDANVTYNINDNFSAVVEAINLLDTPTSFVDGLGFPAAFEDNGRRILFGVKAKF